MSRTWLSIFACASVLWTGCLDSTGECRSGSTWDGTRCVDVDECASGGNDCDPLATCTNVEGGYSCACKSGFSGDGKSCADLDECADGNGPCLGTSTCRNTVGAYACDCAPGFAYDGAGCADEDECANGNGPCLGASSCRNTIGSFTCECAAGFGYDGADCVDLDECAGADAPCLGSSTCRNTAGSYSCDCESGFAYDGADCADVDECAEGNGPCLGSSSCRNAEGSYSCGCESGFAYDGFDCVDLDECAEGNGPCLGSSTCRNTAGSYSCDCDSGFAYDGADCVDVDECAGGNGPCLGASSCRNTTGSYSCDCASGFLYDGADCADVDECATGNGGCVPDAVCSNQLGAPPSCECRDFFVGDGMSCEPAYCPLPGLVGYWEGEGDALDSAAGLAAGASGTVGYVQGRVGQAFAFDGSSHLAVTGMASLPLGGHPSTVCAWFRTDRAGCCSNVWGIGVRGADDAAFGLQLHDGGVLRVMGWHNDVDFAVGYQVGTWYHACVVQDGASSALYLDGALVGAQPQSLGYQQPDLYVGSLADGDWLQGAVDELMVFDRALAGSEVDSLFRTTRHACQPPPNPPTGVAYPEPALALLAGSEIAPQTPTVTGGQPTSWTVTPALPQGLSLDPATGVLSGTPTQATATALYTVTASNDDGSATAELSIEIVVAPSGLRLLHGQNGRIFAFSWTGGSGLGPCKLQYQRDDGEWIDLAATPSLHDCDQTLAGEQESFPAEDYWTRRFDAAGVAVRVVRASDGLVLGVFPERATCPYAIGASSSPTPDVDEDCDGRWDNSGPGIWVDTGLHQNCFPESSEYSGAWDPTYNPDPAVWKYAHVGGGRWRFHPATGLSCRSDWYDWWEWRDGGHL